ncbi:Pentatricopeptide repeat-containing protein, chloroplastic [Symbiodinium microadriaticum]|uniref:Pentatricopeptide repeat-containing protein, chloroplastic n=1 Tax=Symbiodinium microadriaticum TaxID=2951 RepID=A0A1Q9DG71_SYMMI|nr:Pentatricopeptide repeat-containing protein, chloroplastic [Symbiodinium microadriaticum]
MLLSPVQSFVGGYGFEVSVVLEVLPDTVRFNATAAACAQAAAVRSPPDVLSFGGALKVLYNSTISACEKGAQWPFALQLLVDMPMVTATPNQVSCSTGITACAGDWQGAHRLFCQFATSEPPNAVVLGASIGACQQAGAWPSALLLLLSSAAEGLRPNEVAINSAISVCEEAGHWRSGLHLLMDMPSSTPQVETRAVEESFSVPVLSGRAHLGAQKRAVAADSVSFSAALSACERASCWEMGLALLSQLEEARLTADSFTCAAALSACEKGSQWQRSRQSPRASLAPLIPPTSEKAAQWPMALQILHDMSAMRQLADQVTFNAAMSACQQGGWRVTLQLLSVDIRFLDFLYHECGWRLTSTFNFLVDLAATTACLTPQDMRAKEVGSEVSLVMASGSWILNGTVPLLDLLIIGRNGAPASN